MTLVRPDLCKNDSEREKKMFKTKHSIDAPAMHSLTRMEIQQLAALEKLKFFISKAGCIKNLNHERFWVDETQTEPSLRNETLSEVLEE